MVTSHCHCEMLLFIMHAARCMEATRWMAIAYSTIRQTPASLKHNPQSISLCLQSTRGARSPRCCRVIGTPVQRATAHGRELRDSSSAMGNLTNLRNRRPIPHNHNHGHKRGVFHRPCCLFAAVFFFLRFGWLLLANVAARSDFCLTSTKRGNLAAVGAVHVHGPHLSAPPLAAPACVSLHPQMPVNPASSPPPPSSSSVPPLLDRSATITTPTATAAAATAV